MNARFSNAYFASVMLHGLLAAAILLSAYFMRDETVNTKIIELVRGADDNYGALVAPALGDPNSTKLAEPGADAQPPLPLPPAAATPFQAVAQQPKTEATPLPKTPNFTRIIERKLKAYEIKKAKEDAAAAKKAAEEAEAAKKAEEARQKAEALKPNTMSKLEFDRLHPNQPNASQQPSNALPKIAKLDTKGIRGGVVGGSTDNTKGGAGGTALSREETDRLSEYLSALVQRLKKAHERPTGLSDLLTAVAECYISESGTISQARISRSSGSPEFDQSVMSAFRNVDVIPRTDGGGTIKREFIFKMRDD